MFKQNLVDYKKKRYNLITDFLLFKSKKSNSDKFLELPVFDKNYDLKKNIIYYKKWNNYKIKLNEIKKNLKLYEYFLKELSIFLNNYHNKNYSKRYWSIILGPWLYWFISSVSFKWNLINSLKNKKYTFKKKKIDVKDIIPVGIEDFNKLMITDYWNHYIYTKIIEHSFSKKFFVQTNGKISNNLERKKIYKNLNNKTLKERISLLIQKIFNFLPQNKNVLIFSTYMSNLDEIKLNLIVNKSILYYKSLRPYLLFRQKNLFNFKRKRLKILKSKKIGLHNFLGKELLINLPSTYLENFNRIENIVNKIPFPKAPKKIFTCLGVSRSTIMDRYIAKNVEKGASLILAQHGGNYFQHKLHFSTMHEVKISDKYLSWGDVKIKNVVPLGIIKNLKNTKKKTNRIIVEIRMRKGYNREIKIDSGFIESKNYFKNLCIFFSLIKGKKISENLYVKLHQTKSFWQEKKQFLYHNSQLKFLDEKKKMIEEMNSAKLVIQTFCSTGHLECLAINRPTLILFVHNLNLLNSKSKGYLKKFIRLGIVHRTPTSLYNMLEKLTTRKKIDNWWFQTKKQSLLNKYRKDFAFFNNQKVSHLKKIIKNV